ncbi:Mth938-like domain-containing protein [Micromonospora yangpuensis]|uniref:Mth938-like domain-containing protein n=1 Tax=Micromonospora yangpuensis TaxID=683228 RepID=UPI000B83E231|nr:Mth938-like domain-containing protein [Micromonospora yangpuensis]
MIPAKHADRGVSIRSGSLHRTFSRGRRGSVQRGAAVSSETTRSPLVLAISWGHMDVEDLGVGKDFKLYPSGGRPWDWSETGTRHSPGVQPDDVLELLAHGATTVVLSRGMRLQLQVDPRTLSLLEERGVTVHVAETTEAVQIYNDLATSGTAVAGLFHSTC